MSIKAQHPMTGWDLSHANSDQPGRSMMQFKAAIAMEGAAAHQAWGIPATSVGSLWSKSARQSISRWAGYTLYGVREVMSPSAFLTLPRILRLLLGGEQK